jgi:type II secretory pathway pseudopilin PulG
LFKRALNIFAFSKEMTKLRTPKSVKVKGMTLLEIVISITIFVLLSAAFAGIFNQAIFVYRGLKDKNIAAQKAQTAMTWLDRDISSASCIYQANAASISLRNPNWFYVKYHLDAVDPTILLRSDLISDYVVSEGVENFDLNYFDIANDPTSDPLQIETVEVNLTTSSGAKQFALHTVAVPELTAQCWRYRRKITIDSSQVPADLTNFPVLINTKDFVSPADLQDTLKDVANGGHVEQSDGGDIFFTSSDGTTKLDHEIEQYTASTGKLVAWVKIDTLSSTVDSVIYMYYGNSSPTIPDQWNIPGVWDTNFRLVNHMKDDPSVSTDCAGGVGTKESCDSTSNSNNGDSYGTMTTGDLVAGNVGQAIDFDASDDYIDTGSSSSLDQFTAITLSTWINPRSEGEGPDGARIIEKKGSGDGWEFFIVDSYVNAINFEVDYSSTDLRRLTNNNSFSLNTWQYVVVTWDGSIDLNNIHIYVDGVETGYQLERSGSGTRGNDSTQSVFIGGNGNAIGEDNFDGIIDEVRISNTTRSADWIASSFNNQSDPVSFMVFDPEEVFW